MGNLSYEKYNFERITLVLTRPLPVAVDLSKSQLNGLAEGQEPLTRGVRELNVSENLIKDWDTVTNICQHLPRLKSLTVSGNRKLRAPDSNDGSQV